MSVDAAQLQSARQRRWYWLAAILLVAGALAAGGWTAYVALSRADPVPAPIAPRAAPPAAAIQGPPPAVPPPSVAVAAPAAPSPTTLESRLLGIEERLGAIARDAEAASDNAGRAEALLIAFAARRALDKGLPLGYLQDQLLRRFGSEQPKAVATIVAAAADPVTLEQLRARLADLGPKLISGSAAGNGFWSGLSRELSELFVLRSEGAPSPASSQRFERAQRLIDAGHVDAAVTVVETLSGRKLAARWLIDARRYAEARRALDLIETAAILEPQAADAPALPVPPRR
ncbi:MAG: hypothetical protein RLZZ58_1543 [Pseudomonadota bacterium]